MGCCPSKKQRDKNESTKTVTKTLSPIVAPRTAFSAPHVVSLVPTYHKLAPDVSHSGVNLLVIIVSDFSDAVSLAEKEENCGITPDTDSSIKDPLVATRVSANVYEVKQFHNKLLQREMYNLTRLEKEDEVSSDGVMSRRHSWNSRPTWLTLTSIVEGSKSVADLNVEEVQKDEIHFLEGFLGITINLTPEDKERTIIEGTPI